VAITDAQVKLVQGTFDRLREDFETHSAVFYDALFRRAPRLRSLFRDDLEGQGMKFMTTLDVIVQRLGEEEKIAQQYVGLGRTHALLGVHARDFEVMGEALVDTMRNALGADFTPEAEAAWREAYALVSATMIRRGEIPR
jgi:hemoglobin-like flavoprotein